MFQILPSSTSLVIYTIMVKLGSTFGHYFNANINFFYFENTHLFLLAVDLEGTRQVLVNTTTWYNCMASHSSTDNGERPDAFLPTTPIV
mmetsp:Transcript_35071/g.56141  ORF Transcript_35071/g.56141 Transcript_35071/m.56141 type:complete len:89 (+) Transcript_35071:1393-1659(+)